MHNVQEMLDVCQEQKHIPKHNGGPGFNRYELTFIDDIASRYDSMGELSEKQWELLKKLYDRC